MNEKLLKWFITGETGSSSKVMASVFAGITPTGTSYPHDPSDFNRCLMLLEAVPEAKDHMDKLRVLSPVWDRFVDDWSKLESLFIAEAGLNWCKCHSAPKTYKAIQSTSCI